MLAHYGSDVIVYDLDQPFVEQWNFYELLRSSELSTPLVFILTSSDKVHLERVVGGTGSLHVTDDPGSRPQLVAELQRVTSTSTMTAGSSQDEDREVIVLIPTNGGRWN